VLSDRRMGLEKGREQCECRELPKLSEWGCEQSTHDD
jgi:hypothetical protein